MRVTPIKTKLVRPGKLDIKTFIDQSISSLQDDSVVVVASKIVALCQNRVAKRDQIDKDDLIKQEADYFLSRETGRYDYPFTIKNDTLIAGAGIDSSNSGDVYVLWPDNPQQVANDLRAHLKQRFDLKNIGVVITDSTASPMRRGTTGIALAHSGFLALENHIGKEDLFGRTFDVSISNIAGGLSAVAVLAMGEATEQTPICIIEDVPFVTFVDHDPTKEELDFYIQSKESDLFAPFWTSLDWQAGQGGKIES